MEHDTLEDALSIYTTKTKMLVRHIMRSDRKWIDVEQRVRQIAVALDRRSQQLDEVHGIVSSTKAEKDKTTAALKRGVMQFLKGIGWAE